MKLLTRVFRPAIFSLLGALALSQCSAPKKFEFVHGTQILRAEPAGDADIFPVQSGLNIPVEAATLNDTARFLAGLPPERGHDAFSAQRASAAWRAHQLRLNELFAGFDTRLAQRVSVWARSEIGDLRSARAVFYPFSGPDFLFAQMFFPRAETYVMAGLEPCDPIPELRSLSNDDVANGLGGLTNSMMSVLQYSYFITKDMRQDLQATRFRGVLPLFMVFLARTGHVVESVDAVRLGADGSPIVFAAGQSHVPGLLIRAHGPGGPKRIFYFSQDLSNGSISPTSPFIRFVSSLGRPAGFVKSASYLMHEDYFSQVRNFLLTQTCGFVQDPSGVPWHILRERPLRLSLYGHYEGPIDTFSNKPQPDLAASYGDPAYHAKPLDFGIGYLLNPSTTSLIVVRPK
jgi:hypothetical protein